MNTKLQKPIRLIFGCGREFALSAGRQQKRVVNFCLINGSKLVI